MPKHSDFVASVRELVPARRQTRWYERLTPENAERLRVAGEAWLRGDLGKYCRPVAKAISTRFAEYGVAVSECAVREWLSNLKK